jgi:hypothetical protein
MIKSKQYYGERVMKDLQDAFRNSDFRSINEREVFLSLDDVVNALAKDNYLENWKLYGPTVDEGFITTWDGDNSIAIVDPDGGESPSYFIFPATYAALPGNAGIQEIWPNNYEFGAVRIRQHGDARRTRRLMSASMQGELSGYPRGTRFVFDQCEVRKNYADTFGLRLVVRDSSEMTLTETYPIPSNLSEEVIRRAVEHFKLRRMEPADVVRDKQDAINRN